MANNIFFRVQVCGLDGGDIRHEDFATLEKAEKYFNKCEFDRNSETLELYKMVESNDDTHSIELIEMLYYNRVLI